MPFTCLVHAILFKITTISLLTDNISFSWCYVRFYTSLANNYNNNNSNNYCDYCDLLAIIILYDLMLFY